MNKMNADITLEGGKKIKLELYPDVAPISVARFVEMANQKFYDGLCFHRTIPGFMIQGGGFEMRGGVLTEAKKTAKPIKGEFASNGVKNELKHTAGVISFARTNVKDSATTQFFIMVANAPYLDGEYAAFGKVTDAESMKTAMEIGNVKTTTMQGHGDVPLKPVIMLTVRANTAIS